MSGGSQNMVDAMNDLEIDDDMDRKPSANMVGKKDDFVVVAKEEDPESEPKSNFITLSNDAYNMVYLLEMKSLSFLYAFAFILCQLMILTFIPWNLMKQDPEPPAWDDSSKNPNPFNIPLTTDASVVVCQAVAILLSIFTASKALTDIFSMLSIGYTPKLLERFPGAVSWKYWFAISLRTITGIMTVLVTFLFIVQSKNALDVFLNFAAAMFVQELDELAYEVAIRGFVGPVIKKVSMTVTGVQVPHNEGGIPEMIRPTVVALVSVMSLVLFIVVVWAQTTGRILFKNVCTRVEVFLPELTYQISVDLTITLQTELEKTKRLYREASFNKTKVPPFRYADFSGYYEGYAGYEEGGTGTRPTYWEAGKIGDVSAGVFYYCDYEKAWVFSVPIFMNTKFLPNEATDDEKEGCKYGWLMISPVTDNLALDMFANDQWQDWQVHTNPDVQRQTDDFSVKCIECNVDQQCGEGFCNQDSKICDCQSTESFGYECQFKTADALVNMFGAEIDGMGPWYEIVDIPYFSSFYKNYTHLVHGRPIYYLFTESDYTEILIFTGRRWENLYFNDMGFDEIYEKYVLDPLDKSEEQPFFNAYWNQIRQDGGGSDKTSWYAITDGYDPTGNVQIRGNVAAGSLKWMEIGGTNSMLGYGEPYSYEFPQRFMPYNVDCSITDICGTQGTCNETATLYNASMGDEEDFIGGQCDCNPGYGGWYCEIDCWKLNNYNLSPYTIEDYGCNL